jgi:hypothetical protein
MSSNVQRRARPLCLARRIEERDVAFELGARQLVGARRHVDGQRAADRDPPRVYGSASCTRQAEPAAVGGVVVSFGIRIHAATYTSGVSTRIVTTPSTRATSRLTS